MPKAKRHRKIKKALVTHISLCKRGKNGVSLLYKSEDAGDVELRVLSKLSDDFTEDGEIHAVVYPADRADADGDWAPGEVVKSMAHDALRNGVAIDMEHDLRELEGAYLAESFVIQKGDPRFKDITDYEGEPFDAEGSWGAVIKVDDPDLRRRVRRKGLNGVSIYGPALLEEGVEPPVRKSETGVMSRLEDLLKGLIGSKENEDMKPEDVAKVVDERLEEAGLLKKSDDKQSSAPEIDLNDPKALEERAAQLKKAQQAEEIDIDLNDPEALDKRARKIRTAELAKKHDLTTPEGAAAYAEALKKAEAGDEGDGNDTPTPREPSRQPKGEATETISKSQEALTKDMVATINEEDPK